MANQSAREMLGTLRMAEGGEATYGKYGQTAADLLAAEQRILGEIEDDPSSWDPAKAYNAILESGVTVDDALAAGVKQSTIDAIFTSGAPLPVTAFSTPSTVESSFTAFEPYSGQSQAEIAANAQQYVAGLMADGVIDAAERREVQDIATERGVTFQDMLAAGVDPSILFTVPAEEEKKEDTDTGSGADSATGVTVYDPRGFGTDPGIYAPGEEALDREFRDSLPRTEVTEDVMGTQQLTGFDYRPAAKLLSATGSGFSFTPPSVTSRPRSLMDTGTLRRYTQGRAAQDLRQLVGGNEEAYRAFEPLLSQTGSYGGGLSRSQLFALMQQQASQQAQEDASNYAQFGTRFGARPAGTTGYTEIAQTVGNQNDPMTVSPVDLRYDRFAEGGEVKKSDGTARGMLSQFAEGGDVSQRNKYTPAQIQSSIRAKQQEYKRAKNIDFSKYSELRDLWNMHPQNTEGALYKGYKPAEGEIGQVLRRYGELSQQLSDDLGGQNTLEAMLALGGIGRSGIDPEAAQKMMSTAARRKSYLADPNRDHQAFETSGYRGAAVFAGDREANLDFLKANRLANLANQFGTPEEINFYKKLADQEELKGTKFYETGGRSGLPTQAERDRYSWNSQYGTPRGMGSGYAGYSMSMFADGGEVKKSEGSEELAAEDDTESASMLQNLMSGAAGIPSSVYEYGKDVFQSPMPSAKLFTDIFKLGKTMQTGAGEDPIGYALDMAPVTGEIRSAMDVEKFSDLANEARAAGDTEAAKMYEQLVTLSGAGAAPGLGIVARGAKRTAKAGAEAATQSARMLDDLTRTTAKAPEAPAPTVYPVEKLSADPVVTNDPIALRFHEQISANPQAAIEQYKLIPKTKGGKILNADLVRELSPDYLRDRSLAKNVHEPASELNKVMYQQRLANDMGQEGVWVFTGGGAASGKSAGLTDAAEDAADLVMDGTLANFDKSVGLIDAAADSGKQVKIVYIDRDPQKAITQMLDRAIDEGRPVPLDVFLDGHRDARQSIKKITERYADDPRVDIQLWDNQGSKGDQFQTTIDNISEMDYDTALKESLEVVDEYYKTGKIDQKLYDAITGDIQPRTASAEQSVRRSSGAGNTQSGSLQDAQKQLGITEQSQAQWRSTHSGIKQTRVPEVQEAAKQLREGKISTEQYQEIVREFQPIKPLAAVQQMPTLEDIAMALTKNPEKSAGIVGVNVDIPDGTPVASRLDIPAYESYDTWVVSLHDGTKSGGEAIGYGQAAVLNNVEFKSSAKGGLNIAAGEMPSGKPASKSTIARVYGSWENRPPEDVRAMAQEIIRTKDPDWVEVGMNPFRHSYFYQKTDGMPVKSAEQVIQVGPLVLAKKPQTIPVESPEHLVKTPQGERYFKSGGSVERVDDDNRKYF